MANSNMKNKMTRSLNKMGLKMKKYSPEILVITGVVGMVASAVLACRATTKASKVIEEHKDNLNKINELVESNEVAEYTEVDAKNDTKIVTVQTGVQLVKLYAPAVAVGTLSIVSILAGHNITRKRNVALAAAYAAVDNGFKEYRSRVIERFGKELDRELRYDIKKEEVEEVVVDEKGKEKIVKKTVNVIDPNKYSDYARIWYEGNPGHTKDPEYNLMYLKRQQDYANDMLRTKGFVFLNDVYELLGFNRTKAGNIVGWVYDEKNPNGDNFIDFGIYDVPTFVNGDERSIVLDFNVDGNILDLI